MFKSIARHTIRILKQGFFSSISAIQKYRLRWVFIIATFWTLLDVVSKILFTSTGRTPSRIVRLITVESITVRTVGVFCVSRFVDYQLV